MAKVLTVSKQQNIETCLITCPNCQAQYKVGKDTLGTAGRVVKCAQCQNDWKALSTGSGVVAEDDETKKEQEMDAAFEEAASCIGDTPSPEKVPKSTKPTLPKATSQEKKDLKRRQNLLNRTMPKTKASKFGRISAGILLALILVGSIGFRENVVKVFPDMAGAYASAGLGVNIVGLEFGDVKTLRILRNGDEVMEISAGINSVSSHQVRVPKIMVSLLDEAGGSVYEWSVTSRAAIMLPGEWIEFETKLISPPKEAVSVRLEFEE